jgi:hypothetical protein
MKGPQAFSRCGPPGSNTYKKNARSANPGSSNIDPNIFESGVANAVPGKEHIGVLRNGNSIRGESLFLWWKRSRATALKVAG